MSFFDVAPMFAADYYKIGHAVKMQPADAKMVYSTWTARSNKYHKDCAKTMVFGHQYTIQRLLNYWQAEFFNQPIDLLESEWNRVIKDTFHPGYADFSKFRKLYELGYLPISIMGVPEGTLLPIGIPDHVIFSTDPEFAWLPQFNDDTLIYVADMIDANQKLAEIQGSKKAWGGWSMYPDSVMDVVPIGLEN